MRSRWVHLRTCQDLRRDPLLRFVAQQHATKHARATGHPVIASAEPGEQLAFCYPDDALAEY